MKILSFKVSSLYQNAECLAFIYATSIALRTLSGSDQYCSVFQSALPISSGFPIELPSLSPFFPTPSGPPYSEDSLVPSKLGKNYIPFDSLSPEEEDSDDSSLLFSSSEDELSSTSTISLIFKLFNLSAFLVDCGDFTDYDESGE